MKLSELIFKASELQKKYGDLDVKIFNSKLHLVNISLFHSLDDYEGFILSGDVFKKEFIVIDQI